MLGMPDITPTPPMWDCFNKSPRSWLCEKFWQRGGGAKLGYLKKKKKEVGALEDNV